MSRFSVQGFPTILVFGSDKDSPYPYEGGRTASAIESFALEQVESNIPPPEVHELTDQVNTYNSPFEYSISPLSMHRIAN